MKNIIIVIIAPVASSLIAWFIISKCNKVRGQKSEDAETFEKIFQEFNNIVRYREYGIQREDLTKYTYSIFLLSSKIKTKKYNDLLPEIKKFGEKYKDSIPPGGAASSAAKKLKDFWRKAEEIRGKMEQKINPG